MSSPFSPSDAALAVFPLIKRNRGFVLRFVLVYAALNMVLVAIGVGTGLFKVLGTFAASSAATRGDPEAALALLQSIPMPGLALLFVAQIAITTLVSAMALRMTVFSEERGLFGLAFGADEKRLLQAQVLFIAVFMGVGFLGSLGAGLIAALAAVTIPALSVLGFAAFGCVALAIAVRLSLWGVVTQARQEVSLTAWAAQTRGAFWTLMGAFLLWAIVSLIISLIASVVISGITAALGTNPAIPPATLLALVQPGALASQFLQGMLNGFVFLGSVCVGAFAWHQMQQTDAAN